MHLLKLTCLPVKHCNLLIIPFKKPVNQPFESAWLHQLLLLQSCPVGAQIAVMHAYVDLESFPDMTLDEALRVLLKGFRLPGECSVL